MKKLKKLLSVFLAIIMIVSTINCALYVFAEEINSDVETEEEYEEDYYDEEEAEILYEDSSARTESTENIQTDEILYEVEELREENIKCFRLSNGAYMAAEYAQPIHYLNSSGKWIDYDNEMDLMSADEIEEELFGQNRILKAVNGSKTISFANKANKKSLASISNNDYAVSWNYHGSNNSKVIIDNEKTELKGNDRFLSLSKIRSEIKYENLFNDVDIQYIVEPSQIKENIILKSSNARKSFTINYNIGDLTVDAVNEKTINLIKKDNVVFSISAPYMIDSNGEVCENIKLKIEKVNNGKLRITLLTDEEWLNDENRSYPVVIDPTILTETTRSSIDSTFIASAQANTNFSNIREMIVGHESSAYGHCRSLFKFSLPELNKGDIVVNAKLNVVNYELDFYSDATKDMQVNAHKLTENWSLSDVNWNNQPSYSSTVIDYDMFKRSEGIGWKAFDISSVVKEWYETGSNYGILLKSSVESSNYTESGTKAKIWTERYNDVDEYYPCLQITYRNNKGLEDYWSYTTLSAGTAGTAYINDYTGNLVFTFDDVSTSGLLVPISVGHVYNGYMLDTNSEMYPYAGKGFKLNMQQTVKDSSAYGLTGTSHTDYPYAYEDGDGTVHFFYKKTENGTTQYLDEDGLNLELTLRSGGGYVITDKSGSKLVFNASGNLENIKDADGNSATLTYISRNNEKGSSVPFLSSITDGAGHKLTFSYNYGSGTDCQLNSITGPYGTVSFNRDSSTSSKIVKVIYPDGKSNTYAYNSDDALIRATSSDGYTLAFTYSTDDSYRVKTVTEYSNKNMTDEGQKIEFDRSIINQTTIRTSGKNYIFNDDDDIITTYQFDTYGRTISSKSRLASGTELGAYCSSYTEGGDSGASTIGKRNRIATEASSGKTINNLLSNHSFEGSGSWSSGYWVSSTYTNNSTCTVTTDDSYIGQKSVKIKIDAVEANGGYSYSQYMAQTLAENKTYTFSGYIKTSSVVAQHATIAGGACLAVRFTTDSGNVYQYSNMVVGTTSEKVDNGWQRMSITFTVPENTTNTKISVLLRNATGTAYFDCVQLESGSAENEYNLLENSGFENGLTSWSKSSDTSAADTVNSDRKHSGISSMYMVGEQGKKKYLTQTVNVSGSENDTYILSGWVKGNAIALTEEDRKLCIGVKITYTDGSTKTKSPAVFNTNVYDWRYSSVVFTLSDGESGTKIPKNIKVYLYYYNQANSIRFDDIKLIKDIAQTYSYDSEGNLISAKQNAQSKTSVSYDTYNNPDVFTDEKGATYTYTYSNGSNKHRLISAVSNHSGITYRYSHNDAGQVTSQYVTSAAGSCIKTSQAHTAEDLENNIAACAYLASVSDQHGYKTSYTNDMKRGRIMAVTDPLGNVTSYSYKTVTDDDGNTIARTPYISTIRQTNGADSSQEQSVFFTYSDNFNRLNSIRHNGFYYNFTYDNFGKVLTTGVGNNTLITNRYIAGNGALAGVTYGNGSSVDYTYDSYGRVIAVKKDGTKKYTTVYNSSGYACEHNDYENGFTYSYQYDSLGRLVRQYGNTTSTGETRFVGQYEYDVSNNVTKITNIGDDLSLSTSYSYDKENKPTQTKVGSINYNYTYDGLDRLTKTTVTAVDNPFDITYTYYASARSNDTETYKTTQIKNENFGYVSNGTADSRGYRYAYDRNGNITSISERSSTGSSYSTKLKYYYDYLGQLVREDNKYLNKTITYTYDNGGNIKKREIYSYTTGDLSAATAQQTINYGYDSVWKDKLTSYNGQTITSDAIGNPLTYRDSMSFTWFGRQLKTANIGGTSISYKYDSDGNRSYKKVGNTVSEYQYLGNKLVYEKKGTTEWAFRYDSNGNLAALTRRTADGASHTYYAVCNSRGDVEELRNSSGAIVARYIYDTWGNTIKVVDKDGVQLTNSNLIALQNPIRYRGYYFDSETGFYYLQSRYYDPEIGRFINADGFVSTGQGVLGNNMFAYCLNNPVNYEDSDGEMAAAEGALAWGMASGGANAWNPVGWIILGTTAIAAIGILVIPWDSVGQSISKGWNKVKSSASSASISRSISKAVSKAKTKIRNEKRRYDYWIAAYVEYGDGRGTYIPTTPLSYTRAISYVRGGGNVFADSRNNAYKLAKAVGGGTPACDPAHGGLGYWRHYHATRGGRRIGGHVFYVA